MAHIGTPSFDVAALYYGASLAGATLQTMRLTTKNDHADRLLQRIHVLRDPCDLDLLIFFVRHSRTLMASEQLAAFLGYDLKRIAKSLDVLLAAALLSRTQHPQHAARMYVFALNGSGSGWLPPLLEMAATRDGRLALRRALQSRAAQDPEHSSENLDADGITLPGQRPYLVPQRTPSIGDAGAVPKARRKGNQQ